MCALGEEAPGQSPVCMKWQGAHCNSSCRAWESQDGKAGSPCSEVLLPYDSANPDRHAIPQPGCRCSIFSPLPHLLVMALLPVQGTGTVSSQLLLASSSLQWALSFLQFTMDMHPQSPLAPSLQAAPGTPGTPCPVSSCPPDNRWVGTQSQASTVPEPVRVFSNTD